MFNSRFGVGVLKHPGYNIGGGIGETLLAKIATSAVIGGGISALTGGDFLEGAVMGGLGGGIGEAFKGVNLFGKAAPALGADVGTKGITAAGAQAYIPTSPFGTKELISATSPAFSGAGSGTLGTASMANLANSGISPSVIQAAQNQAIVNAGGTPGQVGASPSAGNTSAGQVGNQPVAGQTPPPPKPMQDMSPEEIIQAGKAKPYGLSNAPNGPIGNATGDYVYNGKIYKGTEITNAMQPQSFFDKYKTELMLGGLGLGYKMLTAKPNTAYNPPGPSGPIMKYKLGPNYQAVPNPTPVYPRFAQGGIAQLADGGSMGVSHPNVNFMGRDMYPMSQQDRSYYATPSQMPTSAQQTMANYEPNTNPLTGQATANMASGGPVSFANGGTTPSGQVFYDAEKGQYYTQKPNAFGTFGSWGMPGGPGHSERNYIGTSLRNPNSSGLSENFKASSVAPTVYQPSYASYVDVPGTTTQMPTQASAPAYSLGDSAGLLAAISPNIAEDSNVRSMAGGGWVYDENGAVKSKLGPYAVYGKTADEQVDTLARLLSPFQGQTPMNNPQGDFMDALARYKGAQNLSAPKLTTPVSTPNFNTYIPSYDQPAPAQSYSGPQGGMAPNYSLNDSAQLLAAPNFAPANTGVNNAQPMARGGIADLGSYSDGGRMLRGPGDGMSDSIPGVIANKRPARLADGEFVVPADVVSHLGNGSTDAGAKQLYAMMNKVRQARTGNKKQGKQINPRKLMPA